MPMDQFSFHGPFAYRWIDDVPVERIDLRSGERLPIGVISSGLPPDLLAPPPGGALAMGEEEEAVRAAMAAWN